MENMCCHGLMDALCGTYCFPSQINLKSPKWICRPRSQSFKYLYCYMTHGTDQNQYQPVQLWITHSRVIDVRFHFDVSVRCSVSLSCFNQKQPMHLGFNLLLSSFRLQWKPLTEFLRTCSIWTPGQLSWNITRFQVSPIREDLLPDSPPSSSKMRWIGVLRPEAHPPKPWLFWIAWHWGLSAADMRLTPMNMRETRTAGLHSAPFTSWQSSRWGEESAIPLQLTCTRCFQQLLHFSLNQPCLSHY